MAYTKTIETDNIKKFNVHLALSSIDHGNEIMKETTLKNTYIL